MTVNKLTADSPEFFLSRRSLRDAVDGIRGLMPLEGPDVVTFVAGRPNPVTFPFNSITLEMKPPLGDSHFPTPTDSTKSSEGVVNLRIEGEALETALQYGPSAGIGALLDWLTNLQEEVHGRNRAREGWAVTVGSGCQDLMSKAFHSCLNPGDSVLLETPMYAGVMPILHELNADMVEVEVDDQGLNAQSLAKILAEWPVDKPRPKIIYSTPVGSNPTGCSAYEQRKLEVLELCKKYDLMIFEDDPYYYLATESIPSYFSLETRVFPGGGRVVRFDSFSKLLSAGMRLGYATGPARILKAIDVNTAAANLHTSGVSQSIALRLLQYWGLKGFREHATRVADFYADRREIFEKLAHKHLDGLATWVSPKHSMFCWVEINDIDDTYDLVLKEALAKGVLAVPGQNFYPSGRKSAHLRVSFSIIDLEDGPLNAELGLKRLAEAIRERRAKMGLPAI